MAKPVERGGAPATGDQVRVLWLAKGLGPGGMERLLVNHARVGDRERFSYRAAHVVDRPDSVVPELEELGVPCTRLGVDRPWPQDLRRLIREERIDVVHTHSPLPAAVARSLCAAARPARPHVYTEHNTWDCYVRTTRLANAVTYPLDAATFAVSNDARRSVPAPLRRRVEVLTHGIDLEAARSHRAEREPARAELGLTERDVLVLTVAHLRVEKGYDVLLRAARDVVDRHAEVVFASVGHGPLEDELRRAHARSGLGGRFRFLGFRPDVGRLLAAADVFCLASRQEGLPVAFMEATAMGVPTVATAVGGLVDHVREGPDSPGVLVPPDDPAALGAALGRLVADAALRRRMGAAAEVESRHFDASHAVRRQEAVYARLVAGAGSVAEVG